MLGDVEIGHRQVGDGEIGNADGALRADRQARGRHLTTGIELKVAAGVNRVSLGAQSFDGIDRSSAACRNEAGKQANNSQQCGDDYQRRWIPRL